MQASKSEVINWWTRASIHQTKICSQTIFRDPNHNYLCKLFIWRQIIGPESSYRARGFRSKSFQRLFLPFYMSSLVWFVNWWCGLTIKTECLNDWTKKNCVYSPHADAAFVKCPWQKWVGEKPMQKKKTFLYHLFLCL